MKNRTNYLASDQHILDIAIPANPQHEYLVSRLALTHDIKQYGELLIIAMYDIEGRLKSYQTINRDGKKRFAKGCQIKDTYYLIGELSPKIIFCEGFATGSAIYQANRLPVVVCFNENNLRSMPAKFRRKLPRAEFFIAADDDYRAGGSTNVGVKAALAGAKASDGKVIYPLSKDKVRRKQDFADVLLRDGKEYLTDILTEQIQ